MHPLLPLIKNLIGILTLKIVWNPWKIKTNEVYLNNFKERQAKNGLKFTVIGLLHIKMKLDKTFAYSFENNK